jgi:signal transduction histidine kinase
LAGRLIYAQEEERTRIARELHDDVGQRVASLSIGLSNLKRRVPNPDDTARSELSGLQQQVVGLAKDLRDLSHELHPGALEHVGLLEALRSRCEEINGGSGIRVDVKVADGWSEVANDIELCLYRVAQEALRNITKHAHATTAHISLARRNGQVVMRITDDGRGFQKNGTNGQHGIGLLSMRERVRMLEGSFEVESSSRGTVATVVIPTGERH